MGSAAARVVGGLKPDPTELSLRPRDGVWVLSKCYGEVLRRKGDSESTQITQGHTASNKVRTRTQVCVWLLGQAA